MSLYTIWTAHVQSSHLCSDYDCGMHWEGCSAFLLALFFFWHETVLRDCYWTYCGNPQVCPLHQVNSSKTRAFSAKMLPYGLLYTRAGPFTQTHAPPSFRDPRELAISAWMPRIHLWKLDKDGKIPLRDVFARLHQSFPTGPVWLDLSLCEIRQTTHPVQHSISYSVQKTPKKPGTVRRSTSRSRTLEALPKNLCSVQRLQQVL